MVFPILGVLNGPDIRKLIASQRFYNLLSPLEKEAFSNFKSVVSNFLGNNRSPDYKEIVHNMLMSFKRLQISTSPKIHYLHQHLDFFKDNLGKISDEHGERFHQQIKLIEERFLGKNVESMLAEFIWYSFQEQEPAVYSFNPTSSRSSISLRSDRLSQLNF